MKEAVASIMKWGGIAGVIIDIGYFFTWRIEYSFEGTWIYNQSKLSLICLAVLAVCIVTFWFGNKTLKKISSQKNK